VHTQLLKDLVGEDATAQRSARTVLEQVGHLSTMLTEAFTVVALELGPVGTVDLAAVAEAARRAAGRRVTLAGGPWPSVVGDPALLAEALGHLVRNAAEASEAAAAARPPHVSAVVEGHETVVGVRDWGPGLRTTDPRLVIRPWHSTKPAHRGLGLVTVERIVRLHGGRLRLESLADGARVSLVLPSAK
jgi:nitrogen fixation/metabolism regulation signal transduction histidine kinase